MYTRKKTLRAPKRLVLAALSVAAVASLVGGLRFAPATAACAAPNPDYGTVTATLNVGTAGTYRLWSRVMPADATNNSYLLEVDGGQCFAVGDGSSNNLPANTWTWVDFTDGNVNSKINVNLSAGNHTIKMIGREPSVKIDRVLAVSDANCKPEKLGDNCMAVADTTKPTVTITAPAEGATVGGSVNLAATATDAGGINRVEFFTQDQTTPKFTDTTAPYGFTWDASAVANGTYTISARAYDSAGNNSTDSQAVIVKNGDTQAPTTPSNVVATANSHNKVTVTWNASTDNTSVTGYRVSRNGSVVATLGAVTSYADASVVAGTKYNYQVVALDGSGNASAASAAVSATTPGAPTSDTQAPSVPAQITATAVSTSQINVVWSASTDNVGVKSYELYRAPKGGQYTKITSTTGTSFGDSGLSAGTEYSYQVEARDATGNTSARSVAATATTVAAQVPPTEGKATLRGTVTGRNGRPLAGVKVSIWANSKRYSATTNWRGKYIITNIPAGRYEVSYKAWGYERGTSYVRLSAGKTKWEDVRLSVNR